LVDFKCLLDYTSSYKSIILKDIYEDVPLLKENNNI